MSALFVILLSVALAASFAGFLYFARRRLLTYLHIFQQEEYDNPRFQAWLRGNDIRDGKSDFLVLVSQVPAVLAYAAGGDIPEALARVVGTVSALALAGVFTARALRAVDPRQAAKKRLTMTARARRIEGVALGVAGLVAGFAIALLAAHGLYHGTPKAALDATLGAAVLLGGGYRFLPMALIMANRLLDPYETRVQQRYWDEAHEKLLHLNPKVIGVTGSFGKTSTKHILGHVLAASGDTVFTPGSVNTPMGIARFIREKLEPHHKTFVVEMGAYGPGSIGRLCRLAPPELGIVTAIGHAHYERFKSLDAVARTKFELPAAALANGGRAIVNAQVLEFADARAFVEANRARILVVGTESDADARLLSGTQTRDGLVIDLAWGGQTHRLEAPLYGLHHTMNIALAFVTAVTLGTPAETARLALRTAPQVAHRLEVKRQGDGTTIIDDSYNSNPKGFASALDLLAFLSEERGRRILVTPGMVELGAAHDSEHARIGALAAERVDVLLAVAPARLTAFLDAFQSKAPDALIVPVESFSEASAWMGANLRAGDVVLIENDLPDLYERRLSFP